MEYELYLDVLFLVNFMMDYIILLLSSRILKNQTTYYRILAASLLGAGLTCIVIILALPSILLRFIIFHFIINSLMILVAMKIKTIRDHIKSLISLYIASVLLGGVFHLFSSYVTIGSLFFALAIGSYYLVKWIWFFIEQLGKHNREFYPVSLYLGDKIIKVNALMDTGNGLREPHTNQVVCVIDRQIVEENFYPLEETKIRYIPYQTVGDQGVLLATVLDKLHVGGDKNLWVEHPIVAFSKEKISKQNTYEFILHPELF